MIFGSYAIRISWTGKFSRNIREYAVLIPKMLYYYTIIMYETQGRIYIGMTGVGTLPPLVPIYGLYSIVLALFFLQKMFVLLRSAIFFDGTPPLPSNPGSAPETRIEF